MRNEDWIELPPIGRCYECGGILPQRRPGATGPKPRFHSKCAKRRTRRRLHLKHMARRAWRNIRKHESVPDAQYKIFGRARNPGPPTRYVRQHEACIDCGEPFVAGHRSIRCYPCGVAHERQRGKRRWIKKKARGEGRLVAALGTTRAIAYTAGPRGCIGGTSRTLGGRESLGR